MNRLPRKPALIFALSSALLLAATQSTHASIELITNGEFDTDLSGWTIASGATEWQNQTAHVGREGQNMTSDFLQSFDIPSGSSGVFISFDYQWQVNPPQATDTFTVDFLYESTTGPVTIELLSETSVDGVFGSTVMFDTFVPLVDLIGSPDNGSILFSLVETPNNPLSSPGSRIELDNVSIRSVPEPTSLLFWSTLTGMALLRGRRRSRS